MSNGSRAWAGPAILVGVTLFVATVVFLITALLVGWRWFPRRGAALRDAEHEEAKLAATGK